MIVFSKYIISIGTVVRDDVNIIGVDWSFLASYFYTTAAFKWAPIVADVTSKFIEVLNQNDIPDSQITLVGHSLGCQIAGLVGGLQNGTIATIYACVKIFSKFLRANTITIDFSDLIAPVPVIVLRQLIPNTA